MMDSKEDFRSASRVRLSNLDAEVGRLVKIADTADPATKVLYKKEIDRLLIRSKRSRDAMRRLRLAGKDTWKEHAEEVDGELGDFESAVREAKNRIDSAQAG